MFLIIISIILTITSVIALSLNFEKVEKSYGSDFEFKGVKFKKKSLFGLVWLVLILFGCLVNIGTNKVGIVYNPFKGGIQNYTLGQGYKIKNPLAKEEIVVDSCPTFICIQAFSKPYCS